MGRARGGNPVGTARGDECTRLHLAILSAVRSTDRN